jgi:hypothetical protein
VEKNLLDPKKVHGTLFAIFEMFMSFILRMHIAGIIKQASLMLERKLRNVASALLRNTLLRDPIVTINGLRYYLPDARLESFSAYPLNMKNMYGNTLNQP